MRTLTYAVALLLVIAGVLLLMPPIHAQTGGAAETASAPLPAFDVVTIKRNRGGAGGAMIVSPVESDEVMVRNASPRSIIGEAWNIRLHDLISGVPGWADSEAYDIDAKVAPADVPAFRRLLPMHRNPMLRTVLADRFHLVYHFETRTLPVYALVIAKGGSKLTPVKPAVLPDGREDPGGIAPGHDQITGNAASMQPLLHTLQLLLGRPVVDRTGLSGNFNFTLRCAPTDAMRPMINGQMQSLSSEEQALPDIFTAVREQLGLRLEPVNAPTQVLVVDHIERPTEN